jgi:hypothetical protein
VTTYEAVLESRGDAGQVSISGRQPLEAKSCAERTM